VVRRLCSLTRAAEKTVPETRIILSDLIQESKTMIANLRPKLHRYCARLVGSVTDGEDMVQETIVKALEALNRKGPIMHLEGWLFSIAHNTCLDLLRRRGRIVMNFSDQDVSSIPDRHEEQAQRDATSASLQAFMHLPVAYRSTVILKDVLDYSVLDICEVTGMTLPATKAALHRGRTKLREVSLRARESQLPALTPDMRRRLTEYTERFNARDFDSVRALLAEDVKLELVNKIRMKGRNEVGTYFTNYSRLADWGCKLGWVDGQPAILVRRQASKVDSPSYFIALEWDHGQVSSIRDFAHARYVMESADIIE
jgi:RNA polymerase sigma-70 factor (ECF subfamily)